METLTKIVIAMAIANLIIISFIFITRPNAPPDKIVVTDYTGKVIQVDHYTHTSGGLFSTSTRHDTYITFDNNQTYWIPGYHIYIEGNTYRVHSVKTTSYGINAWPNGTSVTRTENEIFSVGGN